MDVWAQLRASVVLAPLAGGPSTVELARAVSDAGGLGFLAAGYLTAAAMAGQVRELRERTGRPFGVNVFAPPAAPGDPAAIERYVATLRGEAERAGVVLGEPRFDDDAYDAKLAALEELRVPVVSFTFGCPAAAVVQRLHAAGSAVWVTVTSGDEAEQAAAAGADALVAQGAEAGGHRGGFSDGDEEPLGTLALVQVVASRTELPVVAAGGIATAAAVAAALAAGARAAQAGTAFLLCPEAGTAQAHRDAIASARPTALTRAFSGRTARGIVNRFMREHGRDAPAAYPEIHHVTAPLRRAGRERGDEDVINLWAGQAHELAQARPAAEIVRELAGRAWRA